MEIEIKKYLHDILEAATDIQTFTMGKKLSDYQDDKMLKAAVERKFEIIGEALNRISKRDNSIAESITDFRKIISFRNLLSHGYDAVEDGIVWDVSQKNLRALISQVKQLLSE